MARQFHKHYILDANTKAHISVHHADWGKWHDSTDRTVGKDVVGTTTIHTYFHGVDYGDGKIYETLIVGNLLGDGERMQRYSTYADALAGHTSTVQRYTTS